MSSFVWKLEPWRSNRARGLPTISYSAGVLRKTGEIRDSVIASVARRSAFSNLKSKLRIATSLRSSQRRVLPSSRAVLRSDLPGFLQLLHYLHRFLIVPKGTFTVKTTWFLKRGFRGQALIKIIVTFLFWEVNLFFLPPCSYLYSPRSGRVSAVPYLHELHYLHCFLIALEGELTANGYRLLRCGPRVWTCAEKYSTFVLFWEVF